MPEEVTNVDDGKIFCIRCQRRLNRNQFYLDKDRNPMEKCKKCLTATVNLDSPSSIYRILEEVNIPYIPSEFNSLKERYGDGKNAQQTVVGRYIGKMKLEQYKDLTWSDTDRIVEEERLQAEKAKEMKNQQVKHLVENEGMDVEEAVKHITEPEFEFGDIFTQEQKKDLQLKWGKHYTSEELLKLETLYENMHASYDITSASHEDYLMQICKISLRMHAAIDMGDYESHVKLAGVYDKLMKSAKFTASQTKEDEKFVDSISEMVLLCEEQGFIPVFHTDEPQDVVDITIRDLKLYNKNLIEKEHNLGNMIEQAAKQIALEEAKDNLNETDELTEADLFDEDIILTDEDLVNTEVYLDNDEEKEGD